MSLERAAASGCLLVALLASGAASPSEELTITRVERFTDNRGWNEAGHGPTHQFVVTATVAPSGFPTLVFAENDGARQPLTIPPGTLKRTAIHVTQGVVRYETQPEDLLELAALWRNSAGQSGLRR